MPEIAAAQIEAQFNALPPEQKRAAIAFRKQGKDASRAIFLARSQADQQDSFDREQPSTTEDVAAAGLGAADAVHGAPTAGRLALDALNPLALGVDSTEYLARKLTGTDEKDAAAQDAAPGAYGAGHLAGDVGNMAVTAAGGMSAKRALEGPTQHQVEAPASTSSAAASLESAAAKVAGMPSMVRGLAKLVPGVGRVVGAAEKVSPLMKAARAAGLFGEESAPLAKTKIDPAAVKGYAAAPESAAPASAPPMEPGDVAALDDYLEAAKSLPPEDPGTPPSMLEPTPATPSGGDWHLTPDQLAGKTPIPPEVQAEIDAVAARAGGAPVPASQRAGTTPARKAAKAVDEDYLKIAMSPMSAPAEVAAENAKLDPQLANDVVDGDLPLRAAANMSRGAAAKAAGPKGVKNVRAELEALLQREPGLAKNLSTKAAALAKRLGADKNEVQMAINAIAWGR
jgi:hypothetical protein